jgi:hypothetical protein
MLRNGTLVSIKDQGEGWFFPAPAEPLIGTIAEASKADRHSHPIYLVRLTAPLQLQEACADTPSRLRLNTYHYVLVRSRLADFPLGSEEDVSCHVFLAANGRLPEDAEAFATVSPSVWANVSVIAGSP